MAFDAITRALSKQVTIAPNAQETLRKNPLAESVRVGVVVRQQSGKTDFSDQILRVASGKPAATAGEAPSAAQVAQSKRIIKEAIDSDAKTYRDIAGMERGPANAMILTGGGMGLTAAFLLSGPVGWLVGGVGVFMAGAGLYIRHRANKFEAAGAVETETLRKFIENA